MYGDKIDNEEEVGVSVTVLYMVVLLYDSLFLESL